MFHFMSFKMNFGLYGGYSCRPTMHEANGPRDRHLQRDPVLIAIERVTKHKITQENVEIRRKFSNVLRPAVQEIDNV